MRTSVLVVCLSLFVGDVFAQCPDNPPNLDHIVAIRSGECGNGGLRALHSATLLPSGELVVTDNVCGRVSKLSRDGSRELASYTAPNPDLIDIVAGPDGSIYVACGDGNTVIRLDSNLQYVAHVGVPRPGDNPSSIALDPGRRLLWVGCRGGNVIALTFSLSVVLTPAGDPVYLSTPGVVSGIAVSPASVFTASAAGTIDSWQITRFPPGVYSATKAASWIPPARPWRLASHRSGSILVSSAEAAGMQGHEIREYELVGNGLRQVRCWGGNGAGDGLFQRITDLSVTERGLVLAVDNGNRRLQFFRFGTAPGPPRAIARLNKSLLDRSATAKIVTREQILTVDRIPAGTHAGTLVVMQPEAAATLTTVGENVEYRPVEIQELQADGSSKPLDFVVVQPSSGFHFDAVLRKWRCDLFVRCADYQDPRRRPLPQPVTVQVSGDVEALASVTITEINAVRVQIPVIASGGADSVLLSVESDLNSMISEFRVRRQPRLILTPKAQRVAAYGLEPLVVNVSVEGDAPHVPVPVVISTQESSVSDDSVLLGRLQRSANITLRGKSPRREVIRADANGMTSSEVEVYYAFPLVFLICALMGGLLGSFVRWNWIEDILNPRQPPKRGIRYTLSDMAAGGLFALLGAAGLQLPSIGFAAPSNPLFWLVYSALGAMFFFPLLRKVFSVGSAVTPPAIPGAGGL